MNLHIMIYVNMKIKWSENRYSLFKELNHINLFLFLQFVTFIATSLVGNLKEMLKAVSKRNKKPKNYISYQLW